MPTVLKLMQYRSNTFPPLRRLSVSHLFLLRYQWMRRRRTQLPWQCPMYQCWWKLLVYMPFTINRKRNTLFRSVHAHFDILIRCREFSGVLFRFSYNLSSSERFKEDSHVRQWNRVWEHNTVYLSCWILATRIKQKDLSAKWHLEWLCFILSRLVIWHIAHMFWTISFLFLGMRTVYCIHTVLHTCQLTHTYIPSHKQMDT